MKEKKKLYDHYYFRPYKAEGGDPQCHALVHAYG